MKKLVLTTLLLTFVAKFALFGQNDVHFSQFMFHNVTFNPASIEILNTINTSLVARQQWVGFDNAPSSQALNASTYVQDLYGGVGLNVINDMIGYEHVLTARAFYAFPVQIGVLSNLTFGLGAGVVSRTLDGTSLNYEEEDPNAFLGKEKWIKPDFNFGVEYVDPNITVGFASTHLYRSVGKAGIDYAPRHYYLYGKYLFEDVFDKVNIEPYLLFKSSWYITQFDLAVLGYYDNMLWGGFSYRLGDAVVAMLGYYITPEIRVGYAYDFAVGAVKGYTGGSHEIMISAQFEGFNKTRVTPKTPRIFN